MGKRKWESCRNIIFEDNQAFLFRFLGQDKKMSTGSITHCSTHSCYALPHAI